MPIVALASLPLLVHDLVEHHWSRHGENVIRDAFADITRTPGLWERAGMGFAKLWQPRPKSGGSWFDALAAGEFHTKWWGWTAPAPSQPEQGATFLIDESKMTTIEVTMRRRMLGLEPSRDESEAAAEK